jgi:hypothetical protein
LQRGKVDFHDAAFVFARNFKAKAQPSRFNRLNGAGALRTLR